MRFPSSRGSRTRPTLRFWTCFRCWTPCASARTCAMCSSTEPPQNDLLCRSSKSHTQKMNRSSIGNVWNKCPIFYETSLSNRFRFSNQSGRQHCTSSHPPSCSDPQFCLTLCLVHISKCYFKLIKIVYAKPNQTVFILHCTAFSQLLLIIFCLARVYRIRQNIFSVFQIQMTAAFRLTRYLLNDCIIWRVLTLTDSFWAASSSKIGS